MTLTRGWLTPSSIPSAAECRTLSIPASEDWIAIVTGALIELTYPRNWEPYGSLTPEQCTARAAVMFDDFTFNRGGCRMVGELILWPVATSPKTNWLVCDGSSVLRADYPDLFAVIGTTYGTVDGTHFNLPDLRGNVPIGQDGSTYVIGTPVGEAAHTLVTSEIPSHAHVDAGHSHTEITATPTLIAIGAGVPAPSAIPGVGITGGASANITATGGDGAHNNIQPSLPITYLIVASDR